MTFSKWTVKTVVLVAVLVVVVGVFNSSAQEVDGIPAVSCKSCTFLGNWQRNYYGEDCPNILTVIWKHYLGEGETVISRKTGTKKWKGAGWTGQPLIIEENNELYLIIGAYDHHLKKIRARDGKLIWQYEFDDVIKGTGTFYDNPNADSLSDQFIILQGSRLGVGNFLDSKHIPSFRAISYLTGKELWRLDVKWTDSYSRDVDGSALIIDTLAYIGLENSLFTILDPDPSKTKFKDGMIQPLIVSETKLYNQKDVENHGVLKVSNIVTESSPALLDSMVFISSGSGHLFRYNLNTDSLDWDFYIGSDIDGTPVVTKDRCILQSIEKQYIKGPGGVFKFDTSLPADSSVVWFFPVKDRSVNTWDGGIIGSVAVNDYYRNDSLPALAAFAAIDGNLYVVQHDSILPNAFVIGPDSTSFYQTPVLKFKKQIGPSISTPILVEDKLVVASYNGIYLFCYDSLAHFRQLDFMPGYFEATPVVWENRLYIASRNGYLYCLGVKENE